MTSASPVRNVAVIDIGKTNAKVIIYDLEARAETGRRARANAVIRRAPYPHHDVDGLFAFILNSLEQLNGECGIDAISITTHGATVALVDGEGGLALPVLDYEHDGPDEMKARYDAIRPPFSVTGSPRLVAGLNIGAQLFWQRTSFPTAFARTEHVITYPQYWGFRLTGVVASEVTSWGCHSDLWAPQLGTFSPLVAALGLTGRMAPLKAAADILGPVGGEIAAQTGLSPDCPVYCGLHDSNASLLPHLKSLAAPFSVVSTGTWVIAMAVGSAVPSLDEARDTLINVNALGDPVPSARFMGGRVFEVAAPKGAVIEPADRRDALEQDIMLLPSVIGDTGPYQGRAGGWNMPEEALTPGVRLLTLSWYLALMTAECLALTGAEGPVVVEGPFAQNRDYLEMLAAATGRPVEKSRGSGTSVGAAGLVSQASPSARFEDDPLTGLAPALYTYAAEWKRRVDDGDMGFSPVEYRQRRW
ncbi:FGGY-family carbohydrate kinase [Martelella sp. HB161492]|uniref:FGGY-family carbohydrate kinase n=1 Tax=Martelella sp. HB161492 TaxID=2720726 RepID=UPI001591DBF9|nr:FGGY-family carbohydrate kinase [Martelella sp. HB161492]